MNESDSNCGLHIIKKFYSSQPFYSLAVLNCVIEGCLPITSVGGSILLLVAVFTFPQLREVPSNILLASQAVADLLIGLVIQPYLAARHAGFLVGICLLPESAISKGFINFFFHAFPYFSALNICLITMDRYISIAHSLRYLALVTEQRVFKAIAVAFLLALALAIVRAVPVLNEATNGLASVVPALFLLITTVICYYKIARIANRHQRQIRAQMNAEQGPCERDFHSTKTTFLMVGTLYLCYMPAVCLKVGLSANKKQAMLEAVKPFIVTLAFLNPSLNPLVYYMRSRTIRRYVWKVLKCEHN